MMIARSEPILEYESRNAQRVKPFRYRSPLVIGQMCVASTRTNDDCCARRFFFRSEVRRQSRNVIWLLAECARCATGPKNDQFRRGVRVVFGCAQSRKDKAC